VPVRGRAALDAATPAVVLGAALARTLSGGGAPLPSSVVIGGTSYPVTGVVPDRVALPGDTHVDMWLPIGAAPDISLFGRPRPRPVQMIGRLAPGATLAQARDDVQRVNEELRPAGARRSPVRYAPTVIPLAERAAGPVRPVLLAFVAAAGLVLLIACANVATLLVARAMRREREVAVRLALGAGRARVLRGHFVEAALLALAGSAGGALLAYLGVRVLSLMGASVLPRLGAVAIDLPVLAASLAVAAVVTVACGVAPGLHALRTNLAPAFRQTGASSTRAGRRLTAALVVAQIAASIVLLTGAALLARTVVRLLTTDVGVAPGRALVVDLMLTETSGAQAGTRLPFVRDLLEAVRAVPGVRAAGIGTSLPPATSGMSIMLTTADDEKDVHRMDLAAVSPGFFAAVGVPLRAGRLLDRRDDDAKAPVAVINEALARDLLPGLDPIGRELPFDVSSGRPGHPRVVGVVGDVRYDGLHQPQGSTLYVPWAFLPADTVRLVVRTAGDPLAAAPAIRRIIRRLDPAQPIGKVTSLEEAVSDSVADRRFYAWLAVSVAALAFVVALVGLTAALSRAVAARHREIAIRSAMGSSPRRTVRAVVREGVVLALVGVVLGLAAAAASARGLASLLYGVTPRDPVTYALVAIAVLATVVLASYVPARRAAGISPAELMREE
jgi:putative ABC transport system permease protein